MTNILSLPPTVWQQSKRREARSSAVLRLTLVVLALACLALAVNEQRKTRRPQPAPLPAQTEKQQRADRLRDAERRMRETDELARRTPAKEVGR